MKINLRDVEDLTKELLINEYNKILNPVFTKEELLFCLKKFSKNDMYFIVTSDATGKAYLNQQCVLDYEYSKYEGSIVNTVKDMTSKLIVEKVFVPLIIDFCYCSKTTEPWKIELI